MKKFKKTKIDEVKEPKLPKTPKAPKPVKEPKEVRPREPKEPQHRVINSLVGNLSNALELEDNVREMDELLEDNAQGKTYHDREKRPTRYRFFLIFGLLVFWLAIVGGIVTVRSVGEFASRIVNQTALKQEFEHFIFPVVIDDPPEFTSTENMHGRTAISSAIWHIILSGDTSRYERDRYTGMMIIPESDVEVAARNLFGPGFEIEHRNIDYIVMAFQYITESNSYLVPENPNFFTYSPRVIEITRTGNTYRLVVDYIAPTPLSVAGIEHEIVPVKSMIFTIERTGNRNKTIISVESNRDREILLR